MKIKYTAKNVMLYKTSNVQIKQKLLSSIFKEKLVFEGDKYRTLKFNKGIELIIMNINKLEEAKNKNGRQSFDHLPLSTLDDSVLELFKKDLVDLYDLKEPLLREGLIDYAVQSQ